MIIFVEWLLSLVSEVLIVPLLKKLGGRLSIKAKKLPLFGRSCAPLDWEFKDWTRRYYSDQDNVLWTGCLSNENWTGCLNDKVESYYIPQILYIDPLRYRASEINLEIHRSRFRPTVRIDERGLDYYRKKLRARQHNNEIARVSNWNPEIQQLTIQKTYYFDYLATNLSLDARLDSGRSDETLRKHLHGEQQKVGALVDSKLANAAGINGLVFSSDGYMIFQVRSDDVLIRPGQLCSGFSGTMCWDDITRISASGRVPKLSELDVMREMTEELGVSRDPGEGEVGGVAQFLGLTGELVRGGVPEFFYAVDLRLSARDILGRIGKDREGDVRQVFLGVYGKMSIAHKNKAGFPRAFMKLLSNMRSQYPKNEFSMPFLTNLVLWLRYNCPDSVQLRRFQLEAGG